MVEHHPQHRSNMVLSCGCDADHVSIIADAVALNGDCWQWTRSLNREGYGIRSHGGRCWLAHRLSYFAFVGTLPFGLVIDHWCKNRLCVNPDHLIPSTDRENILRSDCPAAINHRKDVCQAGHPLDGPLRRCRECARIKHAVQWRKRLISEAPDDPRHGTKNGYSNLGCRCNRCRTANAQSHREYMRDRRESRSAS